MGCKAEDRHEFDRELRKMAEEEKAMEAEAAKQQAQGEDAGKTQHMVLGVRCWR
jgi:hypothetical protein